MASNSIPTCRRGLMPRIVKNRFDSCHPEFISGSRFCRLRAKHHSARCKIAPTKQQSTQSQPVGAALRRAFKFIISLQNSLASHHSCDNQSTHVVALLLMIRRTREMACSNLNNSIQIGHSLFQRRFVLSV